MSRHLGIALFLLLTSLQDTPEIVTDTIRQKLGVPPLADQQKQYDDLKAHTTAPHYPPKIMPHSIPASPN